MKSICLTPMFSYNKGWVHHTLEEFIKNVYLYEFVGHLLYDFHNDRDGFETFM